MIRDSMVILVGRRLEVDWREAGRLRYRVQSLDFLAVCQFWGLSLHYSALKHAQFGKIALTETVFPSVLLVLVGSGDNPEDTNPPTTQFILVKIFARPIYPSHLKENIFLFQGARSRNCSIFHKQIWFMGTWVIPNNFPPFKCNE